MGQLNVHARLGLAIVGSSLLAGCAGRPLPATYLSTSHGVDSFQQDGPAGTRAYMDEQHERVRSSVQAAIDHTGTRPVNILTVSGGTAWGTYGASFLNATFGKARQTEEGRAATPKFDIVTGVSTGCLIGLYAFLGESEDYANVERLYLETAGNPPLTERFGGYLNLLYHRSVYSTAPFEATLDREISENLLSRVATEHRDMHRRFLVGTVNADLGEFMVWDIGAIATTAFPSSGSRADNATVEQCRQRIISIMRASSAIPAALPPVYIDNYMHVDGGVRRNLFLFEFVVEPLSRTKQASIDKGPAGDPPVGTDRDIARDPSSLTDPKLLVSRGNAPRNNLYILIANDPAVYPELTPAGGISSGTRVLAPLLQERMNGNLDRIRLALDDYAKKGVLFSLHFNYPRVSAPAFANVPPELIRASIAFDRPLIEALAQAGRDAAAKSQPWDDQWPDFVIRSGATPVSR